MTSLAAREARASMCQGKERMPRHVARRVAKRMTQTRKAPVEHYKCPICKEWHVGKRPERNRGGRPKNG